MAERRVYKLGDEELTEVDVDYSEPIEEDIDDNASVWTDMPDENEQVLDAIDEEEGEEEEGAVIEVDDMAVGVFREHTDCVYCAAIHPTTPGLIITGPKSSPKQKLKSSKVSTFIDLFVLFCLG